MPLNPMVTPLIVRCPYNNEATVFDHKHIDTVGTLSMLPKEKGGVVDNELKVPVSRHCLLSCNLIDLQVYGTSNIRVADLSIVPLHIAAHTMSVYCASALKARLLTKIPSRCICHRNAR